MDSIEVEKIDTVVGVPAISVLPEDSLPVMDFDNLTPEQQLEFEEKAERQFFESEKNKKDALTLASQIKENVSKNWFTLNQFLKKSKENQLMGMHKLNMLERFGYIKTKVADTFTDGIKNRGLKMYKIFIDNADYVAAFDQLIAYHNDQIRQLEIQKKLYQ